MRQIWRARALSLLVPAVLAAAFGSTPQAPAAPTMQPKVDVILRPLAAAPAIVTVDEPLAVELAGEAGVIRRVTASLVPSFGAVRTPVRLAGPRSVDADVASHLWPGRAVTRFALDLPVRAGLSGLYDLRVEWSGADGTGSDLQRRAVNVVHEHPANPRVAVIADPSVGDPRPVQEGAEDAAGGDAASLADKTDRTLGARDGNGRWGALRQVIDELNLVQPDFVLVAGDLTFGVHPRALPYEYEDAWAILDELEVPAFLAPGNHDLYAFDDAAGLDGAIDGLAMWEQYFGPAYYSVDIGPSLHLVTLNTFDWDYRAPARPPGTDILSGGQVRREQLEWLRDDLAAYRRANPRGAVVTLAHHDPSWIKARHPWPGANRLELRDLLAAHDVGVHFAGHTHEDRVARYHRGNVVQTNGRPDRGDPVRKLSYLRRDDTIDESWSQRRLGGILHEPGHGPLFVTTTTAASGLKGEDWGLGGYWGWRLADLTPARGGGYDPAAFGYPASREFLQRRAERPENWNHRHARHGLFSYPSYHLWAKTVDGNDAESSTAVVEVTSDLAVDLDVTVRVVVAAGDARGLNVKGGRLVRSRSDGTATDAWVATTVPAGGRRTVTVVSR